MLLDKDEKLINAKKDPNKRKKVGN